MQVFDDAYFMKMALDEAQKALAKDEVPVGAVVVCNNRVIARSHNQTEMQHDVTAHAEMLAITAAANHLGAKYLKGCTLYVTVEPCLMCAGALAWSQIDAIVYGADDDKKGFSRFTVEALHPSTQVRKNVMQEECSQLVTGFFRKKRK